MSSNTSSNMSNQVYRQKEATKQQASSLLNRILGFIDRVIPPQTRQQFFKNTQAFASDQPLLASFLATQLLLAALPLLLFISFTLATLGLSILAAAAFSIFWIGTALLVLVPTLLVTFSAGVFVWLWAVGTYVFCRLAYRGVNYVRTERPVSNSAAVRSIREKAGGLADPEYLRSRVEGVRAGVEQNASKVGNVVRENVEKVRAGAKQEGQRLQQKAQAQQQQPKQEEQELAPSVPDVVKKSISQAHESPEAAANEEAVEEKQDLEDELLSKVPQEDSEGRRALQDTNRTTANETQKENIYGYANGNQGMNGVQPLLDPYVSGATA